MINKEITFYLTIKDNQVRVDSQLVSNDIRDNLLSDIKAAISTVKNDKGQILCEEPYDINSVRMIVKVKNDQLFEVLNSNISERTD